MRPIPQTAVDFVATHEGVRLTAYRDSVGVLTWGYGHTGPDVTPTKAGTIGEAKELLAIDLETAASRIEDRLSHSVIAALTDYQYAALLSFVFNVGAGPSWGIWKVLAARQFDKVPDELRKFVYAGGKKLAGLEKRRNDEAALWASSLPAKPSVPVVGITPVATVVLAPAAIVAAHTHSQYLPVILAVALALATAWVVLTLIKSKRNKPMTVSADIQPIVDALTAEAQTIAAAITAAGAAANAALQAQIDAANAELAAEKQNHADDVAALQAALDALKAAVPAPAAG